jgi:hypothetical protein
VRGEQVFVDLGRADGAAVGQRLRVVRPGAPLVHPVTGETLGAADQEVALLEITSVADRFSTAKVVRLAEGATLEPKDRVAAAAAETAPPGRAAAPRATPVPAAPAAPAADVSLDPGRLATSQEFGYEIRDLAAADLDGDGRVELIALEESRLVIYRWTGNGVDLLFEEDPSGRRNYVSVDAADLDGDGRAEVVVNDAYEDGVRATVLVQRGRDFRREDLPRDHYFRIVGVAAGQPTLVGQRRGDGAQPFVGQVHRYQWRRGKARRGDAVWLPERTAIFDFEFYRSAEGKVELAVLTPGNALRLYRGREAAWTSQQEFDGTKLRLLERNPKPQQSTAGQEPIETPIRGRIGVLAGALGRDGKPVPAFVMRRNEKASFISPRWSYSRGHLVAFAVDGPVVRELWKTDSLEGYVAAFRVTDLGQVPSGVGGRAVVVGLDLQRGLLKSARSILMVYGLR